MTPHELLAAARALMQRPDAAAAGIWPRAAALLARQAIEAASRAAYLLAALSRACHYHPYELAPTAAELLGWLDETAQIVTRIQAASAAPAGHS